MKILIACEYSGKVREAFRKLGHDAWSCDLLPSDDNSPYHIQDDVLKHLSKQASPAVALERELREELITTLAYMYVYTEEGLNLSAEEWATRTVDRKILPLLTHTIEEAVVARMLELTKLIKDNVTATDGDIYFVKIKKSSLDEFEGLQETK